MVFDSLPVVLIGAGGHAKVLIDTLKLRNIQILGAIDADPAKLDQTVSGVKILGESDLLKPGSSKNLLLVNAVGSVKGTATRKRIFQEYRALGYRFATLIHPSAILASDVTLAEGVQVLAGVIIQTGVKVGENTIVNTGASVDHDCLIGAHVHLAPRVTLCGDVKIQDDCHIATAATVIQGLEIGQGSLVGAMTLVLKNLSGQSILIGNAGR